MSTGWPVDGVRNWTRQAPMDFQKAWQGVVSFVTDMVIMPNVSPVPLGVQGRSYQRYKAPHVPNQPRCAWADKRLPGNMTDQDVYGCAPSCPNGCVLNQPSIHNPGPSFANETHSINLIRIHKATVHFTCVRALLILQRERLDDVTAQENDRHTFALARVLMKPAPGDGFKQKQVFHDNISNGNYTKNSTGWWQMFQTGTTGLRTMEIAVGQGPNPGTLRFRGVTDVDLVDMPRQMLCWDPSCLNKTTPCANVCK
jgi:hypothetical protein